MTRPYVSSPPCSYMRDALSVHGRDTHVSTPRHIYVWEPLCAVLATHLRVRPAPHICAGLVLCWRDTHVSSLPRTYGWKARSVAGSAARYAGVTHTCPPYPAQMCVKRFALCWQDAFIRDRPEPHMCAGSASRYAGKTRTFQPCPAHMFRKRIALCRRYTHVFSLPR